jgi:hypothetical protein
MLKAVDAEISAGLLADQCLAQFIEQSGKRLWPETDQNHGHRDEVTVQFG